MTVTVTEGISKQKHAGLFGVAVAFLLFGETEFCRIDVLLAQEAQFGEAKGLFGVHGFWNRPHLDGGHGDLLFHGDNNRGEGSSTL